MNRIPFFLLVIFFIVSVFAVTYAQQSVTIHTTIKLSICGNGIIEGGENCEGANLGGQTCTSIGYAGGTLSCDIACTFDKYNCIIPSPTPTLIPTPTFVPTPTILPGATSYPAATEQPAANLQQATILPSAIITPQLNTFATPVSVSASPPIIYIRTLPQAIQFFDGSRRGILLRENLASIMQRWVDLWKLYGSNGNKISNNNKNISCDLNSDSICDIVDFSILMYYIDNN